MLVGALALGASRSPGSSPTLSGRVAAVAAPPAPAASRLAIWLAAGGRARWSPPPGRCRRSAALAGGMDRADSLWYHMPLAARFAQTRRPGRDRLLRPDLLRLVLPGELRGPARDRRSSASTATSSRRCSTSAGSRSGCSPPAASAGPTASGRRRCSAARSCSAPRRWSSSRRARRSTTSPGSRCSSARSAMLVNGAGRAAATAIRELGTRWPPLGGRGRWRPGWRPARSCRSSRPCALCRRRRS